MTPAKAESHCRATRRLVLPSRAELVVRLPVEGRSRDGEGITEKRELQAGVYLAGAVTKVSRGYAIKSMLNTRSEKVGIEEPVLQATPVDRSRKVFKRLILEHLNEEERNQIEEICSTYPSTRGGTE
jgi:hypothetical protein